MDTNKLRRHTAAAVLAASCVIAPGIALAPASAATVADQADVAAAAPVNLTPPTVVSSTGYVAFGATLTVDPGTWDADGLQFSYLWQVDGAEVSRADTYTPPRTDIDKTLTLTVTASKDGLTSAPATSQPYYVNAADIHYLTLPSVSGAPRAGSLLTADPGTWDVPTATPSFQWYVSDEIVPDETGQTYRVRARDVGKEIRLAVLLTAPDHLFAMAFTDPVMGDRGTVTSVTAPRVQGTPVVGKPLSVKPGTWSATDGVALSYQWTSGGKPVPGAYGKTFTLRAADAGKQIGVIETAAGTAWNPASHSSAPVTAKKAPATVQLKLATPGAGKLKVSVVVRSTVTATGQVKVKVGQRTRTLALRAGKATFTVAKLTKGKVKVTARYAGSSAVLAAADSASARVK